MGNLAIGLIIFFVAVTALRLALPVLIVRFINRKIQHVRAYSGSIDRLKLRIFGGRIIAYDIKLHPRNTLSVAEESAIDVHLPVTIIHISWLALLHGKLDVRIALKNPAIDFQHHTDLTSESLEKQYAAWQKKLRSMPAFILGVEVEDGRFQYRNKRLPSVEPVVFSFLNGEVSDFSNDAAVYPYATLHGSASVFDGRMEVNIRSITLAERVTFLASLSLVDGVLNCLNPFLRKFLRVDVQAGIFNVQAELVADQGEINGYVKPVLWDASMRGPTDKRTRFTRKLREVLFSAAIVLVGKGKRNEISVRIPVTGTLDTLHISIYQMIPPTLGKIFRGVSGTLWPSA